MRSLKFAQQEFYPLPSYKRDTDLDASLVETKRFNNLQNTYGFIMDNLLTKFSDKSYQLTRTIPKITAPTRALKGRLARKMK